jgi:Rieske 2Fe-2S family protein
VGEDAFIITRDGEGRIHALVNSCRHRGARVCAEPAGNRKTFVCPYHGWTYDCSGDLRSARHMDCLPSFRVEDFGLKELRVVSRHGMIFLNCDAGAFDFNLSLDCIEHALAPYDLGSARIAHREVYTVDANWKFALENYLECYHCAPSHRNYARMHTIKDLDSNIEHLRAALNARAEQQTGVRGITRAFEQIYGHAPGFGSCSYCSRYALYDGFVTGSRDGKPVAPLMGEFRGYDGGAGDFQIGPFCFMLNYPDHCVLYRFTPRSITATDMEIVWFVNGTAVEGRDYRRDDLIWLWHNTTLEDEFIIKRNSEGANSHFYQPGPYHPQFELTSMKFISWYLDALQRDEQVSRGPAMLRSAP